MSAQGMKNSCSGKEKTKGFQLFQNVTNKFFIIKGCFLPIVDIVNYGDDL